MIYDCFTFFNEFDILEMRLNVLNDVVDKFVIVEATRTFSNKPKPLYFQENKTRYEKFLDKIIHIVVDDLPRFDVAWTYECYQRNAIERGLINCQDDDTVIISDCDEIPRPESILKVKDLPGIKALDMPIYVYYLNYRGYYWNKGPRVLSYKDFKSYFNDKEYGYSIYVPEKYNQGTTATKIRLFQDCEHFEDSGWHFTYLGGVEAIKQKLKAYSHQERTKDKTEEELNKYVEKRIEKAGKDFIIGPIDSYYPKYLIENQDKYSHLISQVTFKNSVKYNLFKLKELLSKSILFNWIPNFKKFVYSKKRDTKYRYIKVLGFNFKLSRTSKKKREKQKLQISQQITQNNAYFNNSENCYELFMQEDFCEKFVQMSKNLDKEGKRRLMSSMLRMTTNYINQKEIFVDINDKMEFDIINEYTMSSFSAIDGEFNCKGYKFVDKNYSPANFLYELGIPALKDTVKLKNKNIVEIGAEFGDTSIILSTHTDKKLLAFSKNEKTTDILKKNIELNSIKNIDIFAEFTIDSIKNIDIGLIRINMNSHNINIIKEFKDIILANKPAILINMDENIEEYFKIKSFIDELNLNYKFTLYKNNPKNFTGEIVLVCEI